MGCEGCCANPHGRSTGWLQLFTIIAYIMAINASYGCFFVRVSVPSNQSGWWDIPIRTGKDSIGFGLFSFQGSLDSVYNDDNGSYGYSCTPWGSAAYDVFDGYWQAARALGVISNICIGISMIASIIMSCFSLTPTVILVLNVLLVIGSTSEMLTLIIFASDVCKQSSCQFSVGAGLAIGSAIFAFLAAVVMSKLPQSHQDDFFMPAHAAGVPIAGALGTITVETTVEPDGTKRTVKTTTNADGSRTVEDTLERPVALQY